MCNIVSLNCFVNIVDSSLKTERKTERFPSFMHSVFFPPRFPRRFPARPRRAPPPIACLNLARWTPKCFRDCNLSSRLHHPFLYLPEERSRVISILKTRRAKIRRICKQRKCLHECQIVDGIPGKRTARTFRNSNEIQNLQ